MWVPVHNAHALTRGRVNPQPCGVWLASQRALRMRCRSRRPPPARARCVRLAAARALNAAAEKGCGGASVAPHADARAGARSLAGAARQRRQQTVRQRAVRVRQERQERAGEVRGAHACPQRRQRRRRRDGADLASPPTHLRRCSRRWHQLLRVRCAARGALAAD